jgi:hypothetical protein
MLNPDFRGTLKNMLLKPEICNPLRFIAEEILPKTDWQTSQELTVKYLKQSGAMSILGVLLG